MSMKKNLIPLNKMYFKSAKVKGWKCPNCEELYEIIIPKFVFCG